MTTMATKVQGYTRVVNGKKIKVKGYTRGGKRKASRKDAQKKWRASAAGKRTMSLYKQGMRKWHAAGSKVRKAFLK